MAKFEIEIQEAGPEKLADELERIATMLRDGFTCGQVAGRGWWTTADLAEEG